MNDKEKLLPEYGGYRNLKSFQVSQLVYDITVRFCERYVDRFSRTRDQMVQAARSGVQNIAEGSVASGTSKKTELKLTNVARASLEELRLDYEDFLRHRGMDMWEKGNPIREELVGRRFKTADDVAFWIAEVKCRGGHSGHVGQGKSATASAESTESERVLGYLSANSAITLINVACGLLRKQINTLAKAFEDEGGFTERLYRVRKNKRGTYED